MGRGQATHLTAATSQVAIQKGKKFQMQGQKMLMQRIGVPKPVKQEDVSLRETSYGASVVGRRNARSPETKGLWAFPYPYFDPYFASFQFNMAMPKWLREMSNFEAHDREALDAFDEAYAKWRKTPEARKKLKVRTFWVSGSVYTHLGNDGEGEWNLVPVTTLAEMMKKQYAKDAAHVKRFWDSNGGGKRMPAENYDHRNYSHSGPWPTSTDHLEVFLGKDAKIH